MEENPSLVQDWGWFRIMRNIAGLPILIAILGVLLYFLYTYQRNWKTVKASCDRPCCTGKTCSVRLENDEGLRRVQLGFLALKNLPSYTLTYDPENKEKTLQIQSFLLQEPIRTILLVILACAVCVAAFFLVVNIFFRNDPKWQNIRGRNLARSG